MSMLSRFPATRAAAVVVAMPLALIVVAAAFLISGVATAAFDTFHPAVTIPLGVLLAAGGLVLVPWQRPSGWASIVGSVVVVAAALLWVLVQFRYPTEFLRPDRDPGIYIVSGIWLAEHGTAAIDISDALARISAVPGFSGLLGFEVEPDLAIHLQGGDGAPSIVAYGYWLAGVGGALRANIVVGAIALFGVYELARRILRRVAFALVPVALLAASMPFIYFSRASYTEIATTAFFAAAAAVLASAFREGGRRGFILAGVLAGAGCLTRIDTALPFAALVVVFALVGFGLVRAAAVPRLSVAFWCFIGPGGFLLLLGIIDVVWNYAQYLENLGLQVFALWCLVGGVTVVAAPAVWSHDRRPRAPMSDRAAHRWQLGASIAVVAVVVFWASRPAWLIYHATVKPGYQAHVADLQFAAGQAVDPTRSYDEYSLWWFAWYFGWPLLVAVLIGWVLVARRIFLGRDVGMLVFAVLTLGVALLYITRISIAPDQLWAFRRVLPVVTPGFLIIATLVAEWLWERRRAGMRVASAASVAVLAVGTGLAWTPAMFTQAQFRGQLAETNELCEVLAPHDLVVVTDVSGAAGITIRVLCGNDVIALDETDPDRRQAALARLADTGVDVVVVTEQPDRSTWSGEVPKPTVTEPILRWDNVLIGPPQRTGAAPRDTWIARVTPDGMLLATEDGQ